MTKTLEGRLDALERERHRSRAGCKPMQVWVYCPAVGGEPEHWASLDGQESYTREEYERARADPDRLLFIVHWITGGGHELA